MAILFTTLSESGVFRFLIMYTILNKQINENMKTFQLEAKYFPSSILFLAITILVCTKTSAQNILPIISQSVDTSSNIKALFVSKEGYLLRQKNDTLEYLNAHVVIWKKHSTDLYFNITEIKGVTENSSNLYLTNSKILISIQKTTGTIAFITEFKSEIANDKYIDLGEFSYINIENEDIFIGSSTYMDDVGRTFDGVQMRNSFGEVLQNIFFRENSFFSNVEYYITEVITDNNKNTIVLGFLVDSTNCDQNEGVSIFMTKIDKNFEIKWSKILYEISGPFLYSFNSPKAIVNEQDEVIVLISQRCNNINQGLIKINSNGEIIAKRDLLGDKIYISIATMCNNKFLLFGYLSKTSNNYFFIEEFEGFSFNRSLYKTESSLTQSISYKANLGFFNLGDNSFGISGTFIEFDGNNFSNKSLTVFTGKHPDCIKSSTIKINDAEGLNNQEIYVDISVEGFNQVLANEFSIQWPTDKLELVSVPSGSDIKISGTTLFNESLRSQGKLGLFWESADLSLGTTLADNTVIYRFKFKILANNGSQVLIQSSDEPRLGKLIDINGEVNVNIQSGTVTVGTSSSIDLNTNLIKIMPNPTTGLVTIQSPYTVNSLTLIDLIGRKLPISNIGNQIDVSNFQTGKYILSIQHEYGVSNMPLILIK